MASQSLLLTGIASRRDLLPKIVKQFYYIINHYPDLVLSDADEKVTVRRSDKGAVEILAVAGGVETFHRQFSRDETEEIRLHLEGGQDSVQLIGVEHGGTGVRITSRSGNVALEREGPSTKRVVLYAEADSTRVDPPGGVRWCRATGRRIRMERDGRPPEPRTGDAPSPACSGIQRRSGGRGKSRSSRLAGFRGKIIASSGAFTLDQAGGCEVREFERRDLRISTFTDGKATGSTWCFFGYGNETQQTRDQDFYEVRSVRSPRCRHLDFSGAGLQGGPFISFGSTDTTGSTSSSRNSIPTARGISASPA